MAKPPNYHYDGRHGRIDKGYYVKLPDFDPADHAWNSFLKDTKTNQAVYLWTTDVKASFQAAGTFAQSNLRRSWFYHNFTQPSFQILGQTPNSYQFNRLAEFVRFAQLNQVHNSKKFSLEFHLLPGGTDPRHQHKGWIISGYVQNVQRGAERFVNAPNFQLDFTVDTVKSGLFHISPAVTQELKSIGRQFESTASAVSVPVQLVYDESGSTPVGQGTNTPPTGSGNNQGGRP